MLDLREHTELIHQLVAEENARDKNWTWSVESITKNDIKIRWGYLDFLAEQNNCFHLIAESDSESGDWLWARTPKLNIIECFMVAEKPNPRIGAEQTVQSGIRDAIREIAYYAHSRY